jgi:hypothetical protein
MIQTPTNNLYKFLAIIGLLLSAFFSTYPLLKMFDLNQESIRLSGEVRVLEIEADALEEEVNYLDEDIKKLQIFVDGVSNIAELTQQQVSTLSEKNKEIAEKTDRLRDKRTSILIKNEEIQTKSNLQARTLKAVKIILWLSLAGIALAISCLIAGFRLWYKRTQIYQDILIKAQAESETAKKAEIRSAQRAIADDAS